MSTAPSRVWTRYVGFGAALYIVFLVATFPASWLAYGLERVRGMPVRLVEPEGTVWRGEGVLAPAVSVAGALPPRIRWQLSPLWLFAGRARVTVESADPDARLHTRFTLSRGALAIDGLDAALPARIATSVYAPASYFGPDGTLRIEAKGIELRDGYLSGEANATWERAELRGMGVRPTGSYRLRAKATGKQAEFTLATLDGDLRVAAEGDWEWTQRGRLRARGTAELTAPRSDLEPLLSMFGRDTGGGKRAFNVVWPLALPRLP
jgi:hypothetical protein